MIHEGMSSVKFDQRVNDLPDKLLVHNTNYTVSSHGMTNRGSLVDRGANGGILGNDGIVTFRHLRKVDVTGIDNHEMTDLQIVDFASWAMSHRGPLILIFRQYAHHGHGRTIHSALQLEHYKNKVDDRSIKAGGRQCITTLEGHVLPLDIINGLPYLKMRPPSEQEIKELPHVIMTSGDTWNPALLDCTLSDKDDWYNTITRLNEETLKTPFDEYGRYMGREPTLGLPEEPPPLEDENGEPPRLWNEDDGASSSDDESETSCDDDIDECDFDEEEILHGTGALHEFTVAFHRVSDLNRLSGFPVQTRRMAKNNPITDKEPSPNTPKETDLTPENVVDTKDQPSIPTEIDDNGTDKAVKDEDTKLSHTGTPEVKTRKINYDQYRPYFLHVPTEKVRKTFENTTQLATSVVSGPKLQQTIQSPYPAHNVWRRNEPVATDTIFAEVAAVGTNGMKMCHIFVGRQSMVIDVFGMHSNAEFVNTLEDVIRKRGAMDKLLSDSARVEISKRVLDILRSLCIDNWQSEPEYQLQNYAERRWGNLKINVEWYMKEKCSSECLAPMY